MFIGPAIPFALLAAREARMSRAKYVNWARSCKCRELRAGELEIIAMFKLHEKQWMAEYLKDKENANV